MAFDQEDWPSMDSVTTLPSILERRGLLYFSAFCVILIIIVGLTGNALTIIALVRCPRVRSATAAFIISLSVADFIFCCINLPFSASRFINHKWVHGDTLCVLFPFLRYVNVGLSLLSITAIAINRYILIVHPSLYAKVYRKRYIALMIIFIWSFATAMILPTLLGKWGRFGYDEAILNCSILETNGQSSKTFLFVFGFVVPCVAIAICYARIFWVVRRSRTRIQKHSSSETSAQRKDREAKRRKEEWRVTRMVLIIFCSFLLCYLPITIVKVSDQDVKRPELHIMGYLLIYLSACINPVIYGITNKQYRQAYKTVLLCRRPRALSFSGGNPPQQQHDDSTGHALFVKNEVSCKKNLNCNACWETCGMIHENFEIWGSLCSFPIICLPGCRTACKFLSNSSFPSKNDELMPLTVKSKFDFRAMRFTLEWIPKYNRSNSTVLYTVLIRDEGLEWQQIAQTVSHIVYVKGYLMDQTTSVCVLAANSTHQIAFVETNYVKSSILSTEKRVYVSEKDWSPQLVSMVWSDTSTGILATITWPSIPDEFGPNEYEVSWNALGDPMEVTGHLQTSKNTVVLTLWPDSTYLVTVDRYTSSNIVYGDISQTLIINTKEAVNQTFLETKSLGNKFPFNKDPLIIVGKICLCVIGGIFIYMTAVGLITISRWIQKALNETLHRKKNKYRMHLLLKKSKVPHQVQEKTIRVINPSMVGIHFTKTSDASSQCTPDASSQCTLHV